MWGLGIVVDEISWCVGRLRVRRVGGGEGYGGGVGGLGCKFGVVGWWRWRLSGVWFVFGMFCVGVFVWGVG